MKPQRVEPHLESLKTNLRLLQVAPSSDDVEILGTADEELEDLEVELDAVDVTGPARGPQ